VWPFRTRSERAGDSVSQAQFDALSARVDQLRAEIRELSDADAKHNGKIAALHLDWAEMMEKVVSWTNRAAARDRKAAARNLDSTSAVDVPETPGGERGERTKEQLRRIAAARRGGSNVAGHNGG